MTAKLNKNFLRFSSAAIAALAASAALTAAPVAKGALVLTLTEGATTSAPATVNTSGGISTASFTSFTFGDFTVTVTVGSSNAPTGSGSSAQLNIQSLDIVKNTFSTGPATLQIALSDDSFTFPGSAGSTVNLLSSLGGTLTNYHIGDSVSFQSNSKDSSNNVITAGPSTFTSPSSAVNSSDQESFNLAPVASGPFVRPSPYTVASLATVTFTNPGESFNISGTSTVSVSVTPAPEPTTVALLAGGSALMLRRRRRAINR